MAESGGVSKGVRVEKDWQQIKDEISCSICGDLLCNAKTIPCLHTFCKQCIERSIESNKEALKVPCCPLCHASLLQGEIVESFPINFLLEEVMKIFTMSKTTAPRKVLLDNCSCKNTLTVVWCVTCQALFCYDCDMTHEKHKNVMIGDFLLNPQEHLVVSTDSIVLEALKSCDTHAKLLILYCQTCNRLICRDCTLNDHHGHNFIVPLDKESLKNKPKPLGLKRIFGKVMFKSNKVQMSYSNPSSAAIHTYLLCVAKYDYLSRTDTDLGFNKGDLLYILNADDKDWWYVRSKLSDQEGYVPSSYVVEYGSLDAEDWYCGDMCRLDAEKQLMQPGNSNGAFLVRQRKSFVLSIRNADTVKHYHIRQRDDSNYYINRRVTFLTIQDLVNHYKKDADGLAQQLRVPSVRLDQSEIKSLYYHDGWETQRTSIQLEKKVSFWSKYSEVWSGLWNNSTVVAVKVLKPEFVNLSDFIAAAKVMKNFNHPNLLKLYAVCTLEEPIYMVTELMKHGALLDYLRKGDERYLKLPQLIDIVTQIAGGMTYLEEHSFVHGDLATRNVLVGKHNIYKLADYGIADLIHDSSLPWEFVMGIKWAAPEVVHHHKLSIKSDVWSFGIVIWEVLKKGAMPYPGLSSHQVLENIEKGYRMPPPDNCPDNLYQIMMSCWRHDPDCRPKFEHLECQLQDLMSAIESVDKIPL